jgi:NADH-quinone oxidoreductase subunit G
VLADIGAGASVPADKLSNGTAARLDGERASHAAPPVVAGIYQLDSIVRRAPSLQLTADARTTQAAAAQEVFA